MIRRRDRAGIVVATRPEGVIVKGEPDAIDRFRDQAREALAKIDLEQVGSAASTAMSVLDALPVTLPGQFGASKIATPTADVAAAAAIQEASGSSPAGAPALIAIDQEGGNVARLPWPPLRRSGRARNAPPSEHPRGGTGDRCQPPRLGDQRRPRARRRRGAADRVHRASGTVVRAGSGGGRRVGPCIRGGTRRGGRRRGAEALSRAGCGDREHRRGGGGRRPPGRGVAQRRSAAVRGRNRRRRRHGDDVERDLPGGRRATGALLVDLDRGGPAQELGFDGVVVSDALDTPSLEPAGTIGERAVRAATAGADLLIGSAPQTCVEAQAALADAIASGDLLLEQAQLGYQRVQDLRADLAAAP